MKTESGDILVCVFPQLKELDIDSAENKAYLTLSSFIFCLIVFCISYFKSSSLETYRNLQAREKVFWSVNIVRAVFGFIGAFFGGWFTIFDHSLHDDIVSEANVSSFVALHLFYGFFIFECVQLYTSNIIFRFFNRVFAIHHTLFLLGICLMSYHAKGHFYSMVYLLLEMITPFTCLSWMLIKAKLAHHWVWTLNQLIMIHLYHCRTTIESFLAYKTYLQWDNFVNNMPTGLIVIFFVLHPILLLFITPYYTYKNMLQLSSRSSWNDPVTQNGQIHAHRD